NITLGTQAPITVFDTGLRFDHAYRAKYPAGFAVELVLGRSQPGPAPPVAPIHRSRGRAASRDMRGRDLRGDRQWLQESRVNTLLTQERIGRFFFELHGNVDTRDSCH